MTKMLSVPALALLMLAATTAAQACPDCDSKNAQAAVAAPGGDALRVVIDAETGLLRAPTAAEIKAANQRAAAAAAAAGTTVAAPQRPQTKTYASGARRVRLTDEFLSYSVAVVRADGTLETQCYETKDAAQKAMTPVAATRAVAALETE